jgi:uncharacterized RDD family membrane protein YckC
VSASRPARSAAGVRAAEPANRPGTSKTVAVEASADGHAGQVGVESANVYAGLVTRTVAFALDAAIIEGVAALVAVTVGLGLSLLNIPEELEIVVGAVLGALWVLWSLGYFVFFWSTGGQTPGNHVMGIKVIDVKRRGPLKPRRAALRFGGVCLAVIPLFAGILMMLWDGRGRCLQDRLARTVVIYTDTTPAPHDSAVGRDLAARKRSG